MTVEGSLAGAYAWAVANANLLLLVAVGWPLVGIVLARIGKGGKTDADGRAIASVVVGVAVALGAAGLVAMAIGASLMRADLMQTDVRLLLAPLLCAGGSLLGMRLIFPLAELSSVKTLVDLGAFVLVGGVAVWMFSKFRGWGLYFVGSIGEMIVLGGLLLMLLRRLYRRAVGG